MQKTGRDFKKYAITSFIVGVANLTMLILLILFSSVKAELILKFLFRTPQLTYVTYGSIFILSIIGLMLGIISIKSEKKIFAICGIIISIFILVKLIPAIILLLAGRFGFGAW